MAGKYYMICVGLVLLITTDKVYGDCNDHDNRVSQDLIHAIDNNPCLQDSEVWHYLSSIQWAQCRHETTVKISHKLSSIASADQCTCTGQYYSWNHVPEYCDQHYYREIVRHYNDHHQRICRTHHFLWNDLSHIDFHMHNRNPSCLWHLSRDMTDAMKNSRKDCHCTRKTSSSQVNTESCVDAKRDCHYERCTGGYVIACRHGQCTCEPSPTTVATTTAGPNTPVFTETCVDAKHDCNYERCTAGYEKACVHGQCTCEPAPTTVPTTTSVPTTEVRCDPIKTLTGVAHNEAIGDINCPDGKHSSSGFFVNRACNFTISINDIARGEMVKDACGKPIQPNKYTAVGHFKHDGELDPNTSSHHGVFLSCEADYFKMVTEDCTHNLHVEHVHFNETGYFFLEQPIQ